jgi:hypothetical protein
VHDLVVPCDQNGGAELNTEGGDDCSRISDDDFSGNLVVNITSRACGLRTTAGIDEAVATA